MTTISFDPRSGCVVGTADDTSPSQARAAAARSLGVASRIEDVGPAVRRGWIYAVADAIEWHRDELVTLADRETGLGRARLDGELTRTSGQLRFYADVALEGSYLGTVLDDATDAAPALALVNRTLGPVVVFGASNFPFAFSVLGNDTASALAAGCPVIAKAHPAHVALSIRLQAIASEALASAGAPRGILELVIGFEAGTELVKAPGVAAVAFTGSQAGGLALWRLANAREVVIPVYAEMGTVNPVVVTSSATEGGRMGGIAAGFVASFTLGSGQYCTKPGLLIAPKGSNAARAVASALTDASPEPTMLTEQIAHGVRAGIDRLIASGARVVAETEVQRPGWSAPAAVLEVEAHQFVPASGLLEECFGAVAMVVEYADDREIHRILSSLQGSLAGSVMAADEDPDAAAYVQALASKVGRVTVNDWPTGVAYTWAQHHGGPWPATSNPAHTSVGASALGRFVRPVAYQSVPDAWLPAPLQRANPWGVPRRVNGHLAAGPRELDADGARG